MIANQQRFVLDLYLYVARFRGYGDLHVFVKKSPMGPTLS